MKRLKTLAVAMLATTSLLAQTGTEQTFKTWAQTPPMGWNSWDCFGPTVVESEVKQNADYMAERLASYGWEYVVVDIRWYVENDKAGGYNQTNPIYVYDEYGRYTPAVNRFPSAADGVGFKALADYVHGKGLKFGIHLMRGLPKVAAEKKLPVKGTDGITCDMICNNDSACTWLRDNYKVDCTKPGAQEYYNSCFDMYAQWGVDFVKIDDLARPYHTGEIELIRKAIDQCGRPMVLSISPGETPLGEVDHVKEHANMWRTVDDFWDNWSQLNYQFQVCAKWAPYIAPGTWPDADMLPLGKISIRGERGAERWTQFTRDEQYTMMNLWTIFKSPLMFGGHLPQNDAATDSLLTNRDVLYMHHYSMNNREVSNRDNLVMWSADDPANGDKFVALFNLGGSEYVNPKNVLWRSGTISYLTTGYATNVEVAIPEGSRELALIATDGGDGYDCDHADWINPVVTMKDGSTLDLTTYKYMRSTCGWGSVAVNKNLNGGKLSIDGTSYDKGLATHANSILLYELPEGAVKFTALAGIDNTGSDQGSKSSVEFMVFNEDPTIRTETTDQWNGGNKTIKVDPCKQVGYSGFIGREASRQQSVVEADITGAEKLYLVVTDGGDGLSYDHADWANPVLIDKNGKETSLTEIAWDADPINGWSTPKKNKNNDGNTMSIAGTTYSKGFGVNAPSMLTFTLPKGHEYVAFKSTVGYDDDVKNASQGVTMEFRLFIEDPAPNNTVVAPLDLTQLGFSADQECHITEMWKGTDMGTYKSSEFAPVLHSHQSALYRVSPQGRAEGSAVFLYQPELEEGEANTTLYISVHDATTEGGYVQLLCNGKVLSVQALDADGCASYNYGGLYTGTYTFQALYSGTTTTANAVSNELKVVITKGDTEDLTPLLHRLGNLIADAQAINQALVAGALRAPLTAAIAVAKDADRTQKEDMEEALDTLQEALDQARLSMSSMRALQTAIADAGAFLGMMAETEARTSLAEGIATANGIFESATSTTDEVKSATATLTECITQAKREGEPIEGQSFNVTDLLTNPSFELGTSGWTLDKQASGWEGFGTWGDRPSADGSSFISIAYERITRIDLYQTVGGLPAGIYTVEASLRNTDGVHCLSDQHIYATVGGVTYASDPLTTVSGANNNDWTRLTVTGIELAIGDKLRLGACSTGDGSSTKGWFQADDFRLYYWGKKHSGETEIEMPIVNGQQPTATYDLTGRRVEKATKGIYIVGGKKKVFK